ncbi:MAG: glycosyltransferase family 2 protein [Gammaproteobacteria bacterium]|nr:glycosyltransferase family 2 protein [Gammaproteobacteria bacterium]MDH3465662.1 glycosyltransferase family 2 protein [Gammaproteobacteria bacterium]
MTAIRVFDSKLDRNKTALFVHVGESIDAALAERLLKQLALVQNRFDLAVVLGMAAPECLAPSAIAKCISKGSIHHVICSGADDFVLCDLFSTAARLPFTVGLFVDATDLLFNFASTLKFLVECRNLDASFLLARSGGALFCKTALVRSTDVMVIGESWTDGLVSAARQFAGLLGRLEVEDQLCTGEALGLSSLASVEHHIASVASAAAGLQDKTPKRRRHLFLTQSGSQRLGGLSALRSLPLQIGGVRVAQYDACWLLTNDNELHDKGFGGDKGVWPEVSMIDALWKVENEDRLVVFDINPAPYRIPVTANVTERLICVPRQTLVIRSVTGIRRTSATNADALFIVSNYNKKPYIHGSLYGLLMQTYPQVRVNVIDDLSTDGSPEEVNSFKSQLGIADDFLTLRSNVVNRGTYWIRNDVIHRHPVSSTTFFVNDSDDYSTAQRTFLQLAFLETATDRDGCFFDIVRIAPDYQVLPLNGEVERYGTASLSFKRTLIDAVGYFQNIRKNADTEFIERVKKFRGNEALPRFRYPVLFQVFDGKNLTSDIYTFRGTRRGISSASNSRPIHVEAFRKHHDRISRKNLDLNREFCFPVSNFPAEYKVLPNDFLVDGYREIDDALLLLGGEIDRAIRDPLLRSGIKLSVRTEEGVWRFFSRHGEEFSSDQEFDQVIRQYCLRAGFHGYVFSSSLVKRWMESLSAQKTSPLLLDPLRTHVYKSKQRGDRYALLEKEIKMNPVEITQLLTAYAKGRNITARIGQSSVFFHSSLISE